MNMTKRQACEHKGYHKRQPVVLSSDGTYTQPMRCQRCGNSWDVPVPEWIRSRIGQGVNFKPPAQKQGRLADRAVIESDNTPGRVPYWDVVDLIEFIDEDTARWIRISYYLTDGKKMLTWGGQTSITEPISVWKKILVNAAREKEWFRDFLRDVMKEVDN